MDKWSELVIGPRQIVLAIAIPHKYLKKVLDLLNSTWHPNRYCFKDSKAQKLTGKLARLAEGAIGYSICSSTFICLSF
jgi:hypothetical protein